MSEDVFELAAIAESLGRRAGDLLLTRFGGPASGIATKTSPTDLVSDADRDAEKLLLTEIQKRRPDDGWLGEEGGSRASGSGLTWIVDPIDGTVNFLYGIPIWCVSVAVADEHGSVAGCIYDPTSDRCFTAARGAGARMNGSPITVSEKVDPAQALIGTGFSYDREVRQHQADVVARVLPRVRDIRRAGSAALDLANVASGRLDGFYEAHLEPWDKAAGTLLVTEAGGVVIHLENPKFDRSHGLIAGNRAITDALTALVTG